MLKMAYLFMLVAGKDYCVKKNCKTNENKEIFEQSIDKSVHQAKEKEIVKQSVTSKENQI